MYHVYIVVYTCYGGDITRINVITIYSLVSTIIVDSRIIVLNSFRVFLTII